MFENLTDENFLLYAAKVYNSPHCVKSEFKEDLNRIRYVKKLIRAYKRTGELKHRQLLNHLIITYNVFGLHATRLLFFVMTSEEYEVLKTFLVYLNYMPDVIRGIKGQTIISSDIVINEEVANILRGI